MGEKRAYRPRKPGGGRKKLKPEYDAGKNLKEQMDAAVTLYEEDCSLQSIADALALNPIKVRKLLITAGVYESEVAEKVQDTFEEYRETQNYKEAIFSTANTLQLSKASVTSYLPYEKGVYFPSTADKEKISVGAERQRRYRAPSRQKSICGRWFFFIMVCVSKRTRGYPLPMKYERAGMGNTQRNCGSIVEKTVKVWRGVLFCWLWAILNR